MAQKYTQARKAGNERWNKANIERISVAVPKGKKEAIREHAARHNESMNAFVNRAITTTMFNDEM